MHCGILVLELRVFLLGVRDGSCEAVTNVELCWRLELSAMDCIIYLIWWWQSRWIVWYIWSDDDNLDSETTELVVAYDNGDGWLVLNLSVITVLKFCWVRLKYSMITSVFFLAVVQVINSPTRRKVNRHCLIWSRFFFVCWLFSLLSYKICGCGAWI